MLNSSSKASGVVYKPRKASINPDCTHYSQKQQDVVLQTCEQYLHTFGYLAEDSSTDKSINTEIALQRPIIRCINKGRVSTPLKVNDGEVCRAITEDDPYGRGFPWKMKIRKIVMLEGKTEPGAVDQVKFLEMQAKKNRYHQNSPFATTKCHGEELPKELVESTVAKGGSNEGASSMEE